MASVQGVLQVSNGARQPLQPEQGQGRPYMQAPGDGAFIFDNPHSKADLYDLHPSYGEFATLWSAFCENIDPLTKIIHIPTLEPEIRQGSKNPRGLPDNLEALMFAIYASAVLSMSATEVEEAFGLSRSILAARYEVGAKKALINAGLLQSSDFRLLQAFVLWLVSSADSGIEEVILSVLAIRATKL